ncbi:MAG: hypothetical protein ASARMPRED_001186 [Alectoria sarmentosa]|nr:MAG: hypothetical protein ASARMPRED_001186 [Alectoria sarmentosa]
MDTSLSFFSFQEPCMPDQATSFGVQNQPHLALNPQGPQPSLSSKIMSNASQTTSVISALGTLIGYIGSEAATEDVFERLLWPQRFFNQFSYHDLVQIGLLNPMGGPMHKAALNTLDKFHQAGLFKGRNLGNMLGTAFFHDTGLKYKVHYPSPGSTGKEYVRNGLWVQAVARISLAAQGAKERNPESGLEPPKLIRARSVVNFLELSYTDGNVDPGKTVKHDIGSTSYRTLMALICSEITGLAVGGFVLGYWRSYFSFLWFLPLGLKLLSALFTIQREPLLTKPSGKEGNMEETKRFEVNTHGHGFLVVEGKESVVLQFFRHYGHPIRNRTRELIQISIVVAFGLAFPIGLMCSLMWMPVALQYVWIGYQLYATLAMYIYRFTRAHQWARSEARLAQKFAKGNDEERIAYLQDADGNTVMGKLTRIYVGNYGEGQKVLKEFLPGKSSELQREKSDNDLHESDSSDTLKSMPEDSDGTNY